MSDNSALSATGSAEHQKKLQAVRYAQIRFFLNSGLTVKEMTARTGTSRRQIQRYKSAETLLPLHVAYAYATAFQDMSLINAYERDLNRILYRSPGSGPGSRRDHPTGIDGMETHLLLLEEIVELGKLLHKYENNEPLSTREQERYDLVCEQAMSRLAQLRQLPYDLQQRRQQQQHDQPRRQRGDGDGHDD